MKYLKNIGVKSKKAFEKLKQFTKENNESNKLEEFE